MHLCIYDLSLNKTKKKLIYKMLFRKDYNGYSLVKTMWVMRKKILPTSSEVCD